MRALWTGTSLLAILFTGFVGWYQPYSVNLMESQNRREPASTKYSCRVSNGYVAAYGYSTDSKLKAKENARLECGQKMIDLHFAQRGDIPAGLEEDVTTACVNLECM